MTTGRCRRCGGSLLEGECILCGRESLIKKLAERLGFTGSFRELALGFNNEFKEHARTINYNPSMAVAIAVDHLKEDPHYYTKLRRIEQQLAVDEDRSSYRRGGG